MRYQWRNSNGVMLPAETSDNGWIKVPDQIKDELGQGETWEVTIWRSQGGKRVVSLEAPDYEHPRPFYKEH